MSTERARQKLGFSPRFTSEDALLDFKEHREGEMVPPAMDRPAWERELFEYLRGRQASQKEKV